MIGNPIIRREVLASLRSKKAFAMQGLFLLVVAGLLWLYWPADGLQDLDGAQARQIFSILAIGQLLMVALFAPAFTAAAITTEREHGTFESIYSTALKPWEIASGKMVGSLAFLILIVLSGLPGLAAPLLLDGVSGRDVLACLGVLLLTAIYTGMIGLLVSAMMHRSYRAIIVTYGILGVVLFFVALPVWPVSGLFSRYGPTMQKILHTVASLSPLQAMCSIVWPHGEYTTGAPGMPDYWVLFIPQSLVLIALTTAICMFKLHRPIAPPRPREKLKVVERNGKVTARDILFLIDPRKRKKNIAWWQNPVLIKEFRMRPMLQAHWLLRASLTCLVVAFVLMILATAGVMTVGEESAGSPIPPMLIAIGTLMVVLVVLIGPAMSGGTICGDVETGVWDLMRTTRLSSWRIVTGKFQAAIIPMLLLVFATIPPLALMLFFDWSIWVNIVRILYVVLVTMMAVTTLGMFFSSVFLKTSTATAWTYSTVVALSLLTLLIMLGQGRFSQQFVYYVYVVNPVAAVLEAAGHPLVQKMGLMGNYLKIMSAATAVLVVVTVLRVLQLRRAD